jgi:hypothetical protein
VEAVGTERNREEEEEEKRKRLSDINDAPASPRTGDIFVGQKEKEREGEENGEGDDGSLSRIDAPLRFNLS